MIDLNILSPSPFLQNSKSLFKLLIEVVAFVVLQKVEGLLGDESFASNKIIRRRCKRMKKALPILRRAFKEAEKKEKNDEGIKKLTQDYIGQLYIFPLISTSMEAQNATLQGYIPGADPSLETHKNSAVTKLPQSFSFKASTFGGVSLKIHSSPHSNSIITKRDLHCRSSVQRNGYKGVSDREVDKLKSKIIMKNLAVFVSGGGSNFRSIYEATLNGSINGRIVALVTNKHDCGGAEFARDKGIPVILFPPRKAAQHGFSAEDLVIRLRSFKVDFVLLAGYLKLIPTELIKAYPKAMLNIHPSLLPAFGGKGYYGMKVHRAVIASGARFSGATIHYVDEEYDTGRILAQRVVPVLVKDSAEELAARVLHEEHKLYVEVCAALCEDRITWREDGVPWIRSKEDPNDFI